MDRMHHRPIKRAPNYTNAALTMLWVNMMWVFLVLWALWGLIPVLLLGAGLNRGISWFALRRA